MHWNYFFSSSIDDQIAIVDFCSAADNCLLSCLSFCLTFLILFIFFASLRLRLSYAGLGWLF